MADENQTDDLSPDERRQFDRSRLIIDVHFDGADSTGVAGTKVISLGGLYLSTRVRIPEGATLTLRIPLGGEGADVQAMDRIEERRSVPNLRVAMGEVELYALERGDFIDAATGHAAGREAGDAVVREQLARAAPS